MIATLDPPKRSVMGRTVAAKPLPPIIPEPDPDLTFIELLEQQFRRNAQRMTPRDLVSAVRYHKLAVRVFREEYRLR